MIIKYNVTSIITIFIYSLVLKLIIKLLNQNHVYTYQYNAITYDFLLDRY